MTAEAAPARDDWDCPTCGGRGWIPCRTCGGSGTTGRLLRHGGFARSEPCPVCDDGEEECPYCEGPETIEVPLDGEDDG